MDDIFELGQRVLLGELDPEQGIKELNGKIIEAELVLRSRSSCLFRLFYGLSRLEENKGTVLDVAVHLRQFIFAFKRSVRVSTQVIAMIQPVAKLCGIDFFAGMADVDKQLPEWFEHPERIYDSYELAPRRRNNQVVGDGILYSMTGYKQYQSVFQKQLVQASMNMQPGDTLIASLPTGGGKSLIGLLPSYLNTQGGELSGGSVEAAGLTIIVVPTVALALDQRKTSRKFFNGTSDERYRPQAYRGGMPDHERKLILQSIEEGTLPVLYTNPESLMHGQLADTLIASAVRGHVKRLVIDEAHIIVDWGNHFRPDFQFLASFREKLLRLTKGKLMTVLMSATLTEWSVNVLRELYGTEGKITEIRCDALRPEPTYFVSRHEDAAKRLKNVTQMLGYMPRPAILYVNTKEDAESWYKQLIEQGYSSVAVFTGDADDEERKALLDQWNHDQIDIMVATTAFGMGVDKPDIRTIIHACLPESFNRYYQEVGRGGRDGLASIGWLNFVPEDVKVIRGITSKTTISVDILVERWMQMFANAETTEKSDELWVDLSTQPPRLRHTVSGETNQGWNASIILLMQRHGILKVIEVDYEYGNKSINRKVRIRLLEHYSIEDPDWLTKRVQPNRDEERLLISEQLLEMQRYAESSEEYCIADYLTRTYRYSAHVCGGCPRCYKLNVLQSYNDTKAMIISRSNNAIVYPELVSSLSPYLIAYRDLILETDDDSWYERLGADTLSALVRANVPLLILPGDEPLPVEWMHKLPSEKEGRKYSLLEPSEWSQADVRDCVGNVAAIMYSNTVEIANRQYVWSKSYLAANPANRVIHIVNPSIFIMNEGKTLEHVLDAHMLPLKGFLSRQKARNQYYMV
ncbi:protein DpdF [Paenibacillus lautus]|uniref:ATP-dependent DNA helicase RecQ n=1 Tax=Paenibacillus lautus TaxID=1401 RepID=A0A385TU07_PAELA|nr:protein DpdF [Paenibacillus lautus]AYB46274.1 ATP-dependent DNA helicase RecQ [Paenibacillus lautus]